MKFKLHNCMKINLLAVVFLFSVFGKMAAQNTPQLSGNFQANAKSLETSSEVSQTIFNIRS